MATSRYNSDAGGVEWNHAPRVGLRWECRIVARDEAGDPVDLSGLTATTRSSGDLAMTLNVTVSGDDNQIADIFATAGEMATPTGSRWSVVLSGVEIISGDWQPAYQGVPAGSNDGDIIHVVVGSDGDVLSATFVGGQPINAATIDDAGGVLVADTDASGFGFVIDEDDMASDSATQVPTQQSVKAYVDSTESDWSTPVNADVVPDGDGTRDLGATATRFAETYTDALDVTNNITVGGTVDGRDLATDGSKLDGIEAGADVTDTDNVTAAGALMDSEVDEDIKTLSLPADTTISTFGASLVDDADAATARATLEVQDAADNAARYNALELLSRTSWWTAQDASGSDLPSRTAALPATLTGLTRVDGPAVVLPGGSNNALVSNDSDTFTDLTIVVRCDMPSSAAVDRTLVAKRTAAATCFQVGLQNTAGGVLSWSDSVGGSASFGYLTIAPPAGILGTKVWLRFVRTAATGAVTAEYAADQSTLPTSWTSIGTLAGTPRPGNLDNMSAAPWMVGANRAESGGGTQGWVGGIYYVNCNTGQFELTPADIAAVAGDATTIAATSGQTVTVNRASSVRQTQIVPRGSALVNSDPTTSTNRASVTTAVNVPASSDVVAMWAGQIGHPTPLYGRLIATNANTGTNRVYIQRGATGGFGTYLYGGVQDATATDNIVDTDGLTSTTGRVLYVLAGSRSTETLSLYALAEDGSIVTSTTTFDTVGDVLPAGPIWISEGVELTYAAAIGTGIGLADLIDDDTLVALHDLLALQKWDEVEALSAVIGGMTPTERDTVAGISGVDGGIGLTEITDPSAPATNNAAVYVRDNGSGKTQLVVRFPTGAIQVISTEP
jgi:hypothetical protein